MSAVSLTFVLFGALAAADPRDAADLEKPVQIASAGKPIDVEREGHSAPCLGDFDGDGLADLLVGEYDDGKLRVYRNVGTPSEPRFDGYEWFKAGAELGRVPTG